MALKLSAPGLLHKTEAGALVLSLYSEARGPRGVRVAGVDRGARPEARVLVEEMAATEVELLVAAQREGIVPSLVIGLGGVWTEVLDDVAVIPLPASPARVESAIRSLRGAPLLTGARGRQALDVEAAARVASAAGSLLLDARARPDRAQPRLRHRRGRDRGRRRDPALGRRPPGRGRLMHGRGGETSIDRVGIVGGGFMGSGIAESAARAGVEVLVHEPEAEPLERSTRPRRGLGRAGRGGRQARAPPRRRR